MQWGAEQKKGYWLQRPEIRFVDSCVFRADRLQHFFCKEKERKKERR